MDKPKSSNSELTKCQEMYEIHEIHEMPSNHRVQLCNVCSLENVFRAFASLFDFSWIALDF